MGLIPKSKVIQMEQIIYLMFLRYTNEKRPTISIHFFSIIYFLRSQALMTGNRLVSMVNQTKGDVQQLCRRVGHQRERHIRYKGCEQESRLSGKIVARDIVFPIMQTLRSTYLGCPRRPIWRSKNLDTPAKKNKKNISSWKRLYIEMA